MFKKNLVLIILLVLVANYTVYSQESINLDRAIREIAEYFNARLPSNSVVVVLNFDADNQDLSDHLINELIDNLIRFENFIVVERQRLDLIQQEMDLQLSGVISDESAQSIGRQLGAQIIISGNITSAGRNYNLRVRAITVETAAILGTTTKTIAVDSKLRTITGERQRFSTSFGGGFLLGGNYKNELTEYSNRNLRGELTDEKFNIGAFAFFDFFYGELSISFVSGNGNSIFVRSGDDHAYSETDISTSSLNISLFGKFPFDLGNNMNLFPVIGFGYEKYLSYTYGVRDYLKDYKSPDSFWVKLGVGADYDINHRLFIRGIFHWGIKFDSAEDKRRKTFYSDGTTVNIFEHGPTVRLGIGYRF